MRLLGIYSPSLDLSSSRLPAAAHYATTTMHIQCPCYKSNMQYHTPPMLNDDRLQTNSQLHAEAASSRPFLSPAHIWSNPLTTSLHSVAHHLSCSLWFQPSFSIQN